LRAGGAGPFRRRGLSPAHPRDRSAARAQPGGPISDNDFEQLVERTMTRVLALLMVIGLAIPLSGCYYGPAPRGGWCYWHPYGIG
jgi:hypothetical protein